MYFFSRPKPQNVRFHSITQHSQKRRKALLP